MYYIYHIPTFVHKNGRIGKIGTSHQPAKRVACQGYTDYTILEEHSCIYEVSKREMELQKQWRYPVDSKPYWQVVQMATPKSCSKGGRAAQLTNGPAKGGRKNVESGHLKRISSLGGKAGSKITNAIRVQCPYCDMISNPGAIGKHKKTCKHRPL